MVLFSITTGAAIGIIVELVKIYEARWDVELDLKHIKTTLGMDILRGKTPEMVRKEIYIHLLAYNLLRTVMWQAGSQKGVNPLRMSLQGARHHLNNFISELKDAIPIKRDKLYQIMLKIIAHKLFSTCQNPLDFDRFDLFKATSFVDGSSNYNRLKSNLISSISLKICLTNFSFLN